MRTVKLTLLSCAASILAVCGGHAAHRTPDDRSKSEVFQTNARAPAVEEGILLLEGLPGVLEVSRSDESAETVVVVCDEEVAAAVAQTAPAATTRVAVGSTDSRCGCRMNGRYHAAGTVHEVACNSCECGGSGQWSCTALQCEKVITTLMYVDEKRVDFTEEDRGILDAVVDLMNAHAAAVLIIRWRAAPSSATGAAAGFASRARAYLIDAGVAPARIVVSADTRSSNSVESELALVVSSP